MPRQRKGVPLGEERVGRPRTHTQDILGAALAAAIEANSVLLHLRLAANKLIRCWPRIAEALSINPILETLDVAGNGAAGAECMVDMLFQNHGLQTVNFCGRVSTSSPAAAASRPSLGGGGFE